MILPFGPWQPDTANVNSKFLSDAKNVYAVPGGYGPMPSLSLFGSDALPAKCVGMAFARTSAGGWVVFAGTASKLYRLTGTTWTDYTRLAGGDYAVPTDEYWSFAQYGSKLMAVNFVDDPQVIDIDLGAVNFSALGGSPPKARYVAVVGDFLVLAALSTNARLLRNSAINDSAGWTVGTNLCSEQEFPDGGRITGMAGGEFGWVVQETAVRRMIFQPGQDVAFRFERIEQEHGAAAGYSLASTANGIFFISNDGFYSYGPAGLVAIGSTKINKWFRENSDTSRFFSTIAFIDPYAPRIMWAFYNSSGSTNFDRQLISDWHINQWSYATVEMQFGATFATAGTTLEQLDSYGDIDSGAIPFVFDSRVWEGGRPVIGAINSNGALAFLEGAIPLDALLVIANANLISGGRAFVSSVEPIGVFNGATLGVQVGKRDNMSGTETLTASVTPSTRSGIAGIRASARVHSFHLVITQSTGTQWTHAQGINVEAVPDGTR